LESLRPRALSSTNKARRASDRHEATVRVTFLSAVVYPASSGLPGLPGSIILGSLHLGIHNLGQLAVLASRGFPCPQVLGDSDMLSVQFTQRDQTTRLIIHQESSHRRYLSHDFTD
jgi:hypothetical protein